MGAGTSELFAHALIHRCPHVRDRLVVACSNGEEIPSLAGEGPIRRVTKPFNLRDLNSVAREIFQ
jgi:hypothetical protein